MAIFFPQSCHRAATSFITASISASPLKSFNLRRQLVSPGVCAPWGEQHFYGIFNWVLQGLMGFSWDFNGILMGFSWIWGDFMGS
jgi:hypothetical protein